MSKLLDKVSVALDNNLPFVVYVKPQSQECVGVFQKNNILYHVSDFKEKGFVFAPFDTSKTIFYIPFECSEVVLESVFDFNNNESVRINDVVYKTDDKLFFEQIVTKALTDISTDEFYKVVLSRKESIGVVAVDVVKWFLKLQRLYPTAFKYCFYHPKIGLWMGATPEKLVNISETDVYTMALAGTQKISNADEIVWGEKEKQEQQIVTEYIVDSLKPFVNDLKISAPHNKIAGGIVHIKTDISAKLNDNVSVKSLVSKLHPTPAVCGFPKNKAVQFIKDNEGYDREFYSGYLGELNFDVVNNRINFTDLYVNLRCMKVHSKSVEVFVGCGITIDSNPELEFFETVNKSSTIKNILK